MRATEKTSNNIWFPVLLLGMSAALYICLFYVRTLQAWKWFGATVDMDPLAASVRSINLLAPASLDQLRWISYLIFGGIVVAYCMAIRLSARDEADRPHDPRNRYIVWAIMPYIVLGIVSLVLYPHLSRPVDTVDYAMQARVQIAHGGNPYVVPGGAYAAQDPLAQYMEARQRPSVYGPVWQYISLIPSAFGAGQVIPSIVALKLLFFLGGLICLWLIWVFQTRPGLADRRRLLVSGVLVSWSPVLHLISHGEGHNDIWMAIFLAGAIVCLVLDRPLLAFAGWCLSVLVKFVSAPLLIALVVCVYVAQTSARTADKLKLVLAGLTISGVLAMLTTAPFGFSALLKSVSGRYGGLLEAGGDSKISLAAGLLSRALGTIGMHTATAALASIVGLALPLLWVGYVMIRGFSARDTNMFVKIAVEAFLIYLTFVAIPVYAQYAITPVILMAFLCAGNWHRAAVVVTSIALVWDSLFLVYLPPAYPAWESYLHQLSHIVVIGVVLIYLVWRAHALLRPHYSPALVDG